MNIILLQNEQFRVDTFINWPHSYPLTPKLLAKHGFYFYREPDTIKCCECELEYRNFTNNTFINRIHELEFAKCKFAKVLSFEYVYYNNIIVDYDYDNDDDKDDENNDENNEKNDIEKYKTFDIDFSNLFKTKIVKHYIDAHSDGFLVKQYNYNNNSGNVCHNNDDKKQQQQQQQQQHQQQCCVCMNNVHDTCLVPCGHLTCKTCASNLELCPQCRCKISRLQQIYM
ncbi:Inhibitor of apoptosis 1 [Trabala vishnou gigantina nucleopolyhedrovirus]|uniref:Inhibitor of apoptosis 1 n=1 Tax=Trabala vishnou gigantina nucleopolyhedrovirus TaxID=2863583 RepID=UPI002481B65D|nr:Inhibitor of apoptosis 1 [Trabala vishnou gigantina nucleopolyhedrovirus]QYC92734.1 Inhibitor of apoptosis 1 [Trabala vishnou gigantina nucleopolyhedrovirus]